MPQLHECLRLIALARESSREPESAYVLRARLKRSIVGAAQLAAARAGGSGPSMPSDIIEMRSHDSASAEILRLCDTLLANTRGLCQPSEALDARWRLGWSVIQGDLDRLERRLRALEYESIQTYGAS